MIEWSKWWSKLGVSGRERNSRMDEPVEQKPYMTVVRASRVSGQSALFDSEHVHSHYIQLRISSAYRERGLSKDWIYEDKEIIEVSMSEAQWAAMISSLNFGSGVPATLNHVFHERVEQPVRAESRTEKFGSELVARLERALQRLDDLEKTKLSKSQISEIAMIRQEIKSNMPFVAASFDEHMETRVEKAKSDIEAHMNAAVQRAGFAALASAERLTKLLESDR